LAWQQDDGVSDIDWDVPTLIPELDVVDLAAAVAFYKLLGFELQYERAEEAFAYLVAGGAHLMLQAADGPGRRFTRSPLRRPFGRGLNLQIEVPDVTAVHARVLAAGHEPVVALEERWYRAGDVEHGNRQFVIEDLDGYPLRPFQDLGTRPSDIEGARTSEGL
jgi:catechol 2,3-dioxygenase-like lactoylglutathione lyase family enzyme